LKEKKERFAEKALRGAQDLFYPVTVCLFDHPRTDEVGQGNSNGGIIMFRIATWATIAALVLWLGTVGPVNAAPQRGGGGHGGGYHGGGYHGGGYRGSGYHGGGYYGGGYYGRGYGWGSYSRGYGWGWGGVALGLGFYGGYPYYRGYGYGYPYYRGYGYGSAYVYPNTGYYSDYGPNVNVVPYVPDATTTQSGYYAPATDNRASIRIRLPANATLWVDGDPTQQTGAERTFVSPPLTPGTTYAYTFKARWMDGNEPVEKTLKIDVRANQTSQADFTR
jgi:uncharacterized protein (TIGR03000 family)